MTLFSTHSGYRTLALAVALALPGLAAAQQGIPTAQALSSFAAKAKAQGLNAADVADVLVTNSYFDASIGVTHTYFQQRVNGIAIFNAFGAVHTDQSGKVLFTNQDFVVGAAAKAGSPTPALTAEQAVVATSVALGLPRPVDLRPVIEARMADGIVFNKAGISESDIPVRLMYTRVGDKLVLVWNVSIAQLDQQHHWNARVDAQTGRLVEQNDYVVSEQTTFNQFRQHAENKRHKALAFDQPAAAASVLSPTSTTAANSVTAVAFPLESPNQGARTVVPLPAVGNTYSPYGWQVAQAPAGTFPDTYSFLSTGKYLTRGNNVAAYDDNSSTASGASTANYNSSTTSPDGGPTLNFDFPFTQSTGPRNNLNASTANLFYVNNMMHDVMLAHGFDEVSGNFQFKNATGLGAGADPVRAESQDGSGRNNANFGTPVDGSAPTMQMYLWDNQTNTLTITGTGTGAAGVAGTYPFSTVSFGPTLAKKPLAGKLVLVNDGVSPDGGDHGCKTYTNAAAVSGNIAFIQRGACPQLQLTPKMSNAFATKVKIAQAAGATGVIVFDSLATTNQVSFGGTDTVGIRIPSIFISGADGFKLRAAILSGATLNGSAVTVTGADWDGSFDNGIVSHEYGHGISNRLTGTKFNSSSCLIGNVGTTAAPIYTQQMGEGWSDFFALWMTTKPGDIGSAKRYVGTYVEGQNSTTGTGIRTKPYTTDFSANGNNLTYGAISSTSQYGTGYQESHALGEIWTSVLWDLNWQFIYKYGYNADFYAATGGNNKMLKLVLDACKLQVCNPGFLDGRDAILRADTLTNRAANADIIWNVFARRGMGYSALPGDRVNGTARNTGVKDGFDVPPKAKVLVLSNQNSIVAGSALEAYPNPAQDLLTVRTQLSSSAPVQVAVLDLLGKTVVQSVAVPAAKMQQTGVELNTSRLATGIYVVRVVTTEGTYTTKVTIQH
ncbi:T9SS type A sorting domain-containing protein [Hymenobacter sp. HMF4947]|uniref:T9SS type A sorting domain-containing protein n=1 Tax=Hymenobacter ginkgonis TaxID=2682976 RepID=A0A7K1TC48_9BACT|nr:M36 family metallopeptidase [Hymenobacter ginkgonis]MVN75969.1 T9SS type A sorting domain-containing protein [Hymenobacter ginkgonis]